jgi:hypothetical protein
LSDEPATDREELVVIDLAVGAATAVAATAFGVARRFDRVLRPVTRVVVRPVVAVVRRPPLVPRRYQMDTWLTGLARQGGTSRPELQRRLSETLDDLVPKVVAAVLARIDLTETVKENVDVESIIADLDLDALIGRLDLAGLAEGVIAEVDLAEIIRQSTGTVASETVRGVRMQGISGDEAVGRAVGRIRLRLSRKHPTPPAPPGIAERYPATMGGGRPAGPEVVRRRSEPDGTTARP